MADQVKVDADNGMGWALIFVALFVLTWGEPDLLDVIERYCANYMEANP